MSWANDAAAVSVGLDGGADDTAEAITVRHQARLAQTEPLLEVCTGGVAC